MLVEEKFVCEVKQPRSYVYEARQSPSWEARKKTLAQFCIAPLFQSRPLSIHRAGIFLDRSNIFPDIYLSVFFLSHTAVQCILHDVHGK